MAVFVESRGRLGRRTRLMSITYSFIVSSKLREGDRLRPSRVALRWPRKADTTYCYGPAATFAHCATVAKKSRTLRTCRRGAGRERADVYGRKFAGVGDVGARSDGKRRCFLGMRRHPERSRGRALGCVGE